MKAPTAHLIRVLWKRLQSLMAWRRRSALENILEQMAEAGEITRPRLSKEGWTWRARGLGLPPGTALSLLDGVRADRDWK